MNDTVYRMARADADAGAAWLRFRTASAALSARMYMAKPSDWVVRPTRSGAVLERVTRPGRLARSGGR